MQDGTLDAKRVNFVQKNVFPFCDIYVDVQRYEKIVQQRALEKGGVMHNRISSARTHSSVD